MRLTVIALLLAGVAGCYWETGNNPGRPVEDPKPETESGGDEEPQPEADRGGDDEPESEFEATLKAAEKGDAEAQIRLGYMYKYGKGVPKDHAEAVKWFRKAAEQGRMLAQYKLGVMYRDGLGVPKDDVEAYIWFSIAATNGDELPKKWLSDAKAKLTHPTRRRPATSY